MEAFRPITEEKPWSLTDKASSHLYRERSAFFSPRLSRHQ
jgi:hypothetical protein